jgi:hypothetical protein
VRILSDNFMQALKSGILVGLLQRVRQDKDLDLEIRDGYLNIYYKGNSLLKLDEMMSSRYRVGVHPKFASGLMLPEHLIDEATVESFLQGIPLLKENIIQHGQSSLEVEYEQLVIRANNLEPRTNSDYFVIDRQYAVSNVGRFDLTGFVWDRNGRKRGQQVPLCFMELKFALNSDIQEVHQQLARYYDAIKTDALAIAAEAESVFKQKLALNLFDQPADRVAALQTLTFTSDVEQYQFIIVLVDYNPYSTLLNIDGLKALPFANQVKIFWGGFAMWQKNLHALSEI